MGLNISKEVIARTKEVPLSTMVATVSFLFSSGANKDYLHPSLLKSLSVFSSFLQPKLSFSDSCRMVQFEQQHSPLQIPTDLWNQIRREENKHIVSMCSCFNPFSSFGKVFWLAGSLLIVGLASVVNPTIGWRWLIRIASIPGIILILVFKVGRASLPAPCCTTTNLASPQAPRRLFPSASLD